MKKDRSPSTRQQLLVPAERVERSILVVRGRKVMLDADLAALYGVSTKRLNEQVRRNKDRFPDDFMFRLVAKEKAEVVANCDHLRTLKFSPNLPHAFTEHGAIMAASVLNTERAVKVSVYVVRAFVKLREMLTTQKDFARKLEDLEKKLAEHDDKFKVVFQAIRELMEPVTVPPKRRIGFSTSSGQ